jgi:alkanesulfonate monooxygenase SsuD/methylene tetrahydromethanopterin reductase-like flavin-dependent oxidoreductase (luciferase family)
LSDPRPRTVEAMELIQKAWTSEDFEHEGEYFTSFFYFCTKPGEPLPLLCAVIGGAPLC